MRLKTFFVLLSAQLLAACAGNVKPAPAPKPPPEKVVVESAPVAIAEEAVPTTEVQEENSIYFVLGKTQLNAEGERKLRVHAERLKKNPKLTLRLIGHSDHLGSSAYNLAISERRVMQVLQFLLANGVKPGQISGSGVGNENREIKCTSISCRQKMRRVEIRYKN